ncbi:MAG: hypothetical protein JO171_03035 [Paludibacterium sp.]|nr:hypothetical protein [Paludibacterium sp.]MBV8046100.1 hypothetical protein [Paludibacterium sp.]MBV8649264.1 hypothetical protein [Paludibacterium sp.]
MSYGMLLTPVQNAQTVLPDSYLYQTGGVFTRVAQVVRHWKLKFKR